MNSRIKARLLYGVIAAIAGIGLLLGVSVFGMSSLNELQGEGHQHAVDAMLASENANVGEILNQIITDAVVSHNLDMTRERWETIKQERLKNIRRLNELAETSYQKQLLADADKALLVFSDLLENRMFAQLEADANRSEIMVTEVSLYEQALMLSELMRNYAASLQDEARKADAAYTARFNWMIALAIGVVTLALGIAFWGARSVERVPKVSKSTRSESDD
ncbi:MAG TPA: hypothetical protein VFW53_07075 [Gallionella sp.]|nr:hypothetical protein [Gallionella sp.]